MYVGVWDIIHNYGRSTMVCLVGSFWISCFLYGYAALDILKSSQISLVVTRFGSPKSISSNVCGISTWNNQITY